MNIEEKFQKYMPFALEFRLGLTNFAKLIQEPEQSVIDYVNTLKTTQTTLDKYNQYSFLLYKDGKNDPRTLLMARNLINKYVLIQNDPNLTDEEKQGKLNYILYKTDFEYQQIPEYAMGVDRTHEDYIKLSKYRLKYAISANKIAADENERKRLSHQEQTYDPELVERLDGLEDYLRVYANQMFALDNKLNAAPLTGKIREVEQSININESIKEEENRHYGM